MTPEQLVARLQECLPEGLRSVVLYGSAAAGDFVPGVSNYNVLVVVDRLGVAELKALSKTVAQWTRAGNRPPLLFTPGELKALADVFPLELLDIRQSHRVLWGEDPLAEIAVSHDYLRLQLERELKGKLLALREEYLLRANEPRQLAEMLTASLAGFLVLFRAVLRLFREDVPAAKLDALRMLAEHIPFDPQPLLTIHELKHRQRKVRDVSPQALFESYLKTIEEVVKAVDRHLHPKI